MPLIDHPAADGSRQFLDWPQLIGWQALIEHLGRLPGIELDPLISDGVTEAWLDFRFQGQHFSVNDPFGEYWFFVRDRQCPNDVLQAIADHLAPLFADAAGREP